MGWVGTVAPLINNSNKNSSAASTIQQSQAEISEISRFHPYNALWAQLGDLYGAIGNPSKLSKTIVCGAQSNTLDKVLNVLTYFIRCGEVKRVTSTNVIERDIIDDIIEYRYKQRHDPSTLEKMVATDLTYLQSDASKCKGLSRTKTYMKELTAVDSISSNGDEANKKNDIPNVLVFRDSRFVKQELRIGNFHMDTGIEMNSEQKMNIQNYKIKESLPSNTIKLMVTSPENDKFEYEAAAEAIDYVLKKIDPDAKNIANKSLGELITANSIGQGQSKASKLLWGIEPIKEGISVEQWQHIEKNIKNQIENDFFTKTDLRGKHSNDLKRSLSLNTKPDIACRLQKAQFSLRSRASKTTETSDTTSVFHEHTKLNTCASLSDLITANSVGASERLQWGIEPVKESICLEEEIYFEEAQKRIERDHDLKPTQTGSVIFVLGDNEVLAGLKNANLSPLVQASSSSSLSPSPSQSPTVIPSPIHTPTASPFATPTLTPTHSAILTPKPSTVHISNENASISSTATINNRIENKKKHCTHKKHSGVKFNFEQYPQIVTNYMKNKNLDITSYDFLEKGLKLEQENFGASSTSMLPMINPDEIHEEEEEEEECECCANTFRVLQTPSNATELEFSNDDGSYPVPIIKKSSQLPSPSSETSVKQKNGENAESTEHVYESINRKCKKDKESKEFEEIEQTNVEITNEGQTEIDTIIEKVEKNISKYDLTYLPMPKTKITLKGNERLRAGFVPSLFIGITDHYISDMVLQVGIRKHK